MDTNNIDVAHITKMVGALTDDNLPTIDFDGHRQWLADLAVRLPELLRLDREMAVLRTDYEGRIAGMTKAIAAVSRNREALKQATTFLETLTEMNATDLVRQYGLMSVRFRDAFPTSFGRLPVSVGQSNRTAIHRNI